MLRIILLQLLTTVIAALVAGMLGGLPALWSALLGGVCCVVPNALFALRLHVSAQKPGGTNPMTLFFGEFIQLATTFALLGA
ncbi:ATP synthase subunit I, partial [Herbaspirillum huttiense]|uniref:ATP synthase subunit I n=1 Tax=Herbaspirillum huttiense TaxID=863372 RepID=UPI00380401EB